MAKRSAKKKYSNVYRSAETVAASAPGKIDPAVQYQYVVADLKRIGLIAGLLIAGLLILSFIIK